MTVGTIPLFLWLLQGSTTAVFVSQVFFVLLLSGIDGTFIEMMAIHFPRAVRGRGISLVYTLLSTLVGGMTPLICSQIMYKYTYLLSSAVHITLFPAMYITVFGLFALIAVRYTQIDTQLNRLQQESQSVSKQHLKCR